MAWGQKIVEKAEEAAKAKPAAGGFVKKARKANQSNVEEIIKSGSVFSVPSRANKAGDQRVVDQWQNDKRKIFDNARANGAKEEDIIQLDKNLDRAKHNERIRTTGRSEFSSIYGTDWFPDEFIDEENRGGRFHLISGDTEGDRLLHSKGSEGLRDKDQLGKGRKFSEVMDLGDLGKLVYTNPSAAPGKTLATLAMSVAGLAFPGLGAVVGGQLGLSGGAATLAGNAIMGAASTAVTGGNVLESMLLSTVPGFVGTGPVTESAIRATLDVAFGADPMAAFGSAALSVGSPVLGEMVPGSKELKQLATFGLAAGGSAAMGQGELSSLLAGWGAASQVTGDVTAREALARINPVAEIDQLFSGDYWKQLGYEAKGMTPGEASAEVSKNELMDIEYSANRTSADASMDELMSFESGGVQKSTGASVNTLTTEAKGVAKADSQTAQISTTAAAAAVDQMDLDSIIDNARQAAVREAAKKLKVNPTDLESLKIVTDYDAVTRLEANQKGMIELQKPKGPWERNAPWLAPLIVGAGFQVWDNMELNKKDKRQEQIDAEAAEKIEEYTRNAYEASMTNKGGGSKSRNGVAPGSIRAR